LRKILHIASGEAITEAAVTEKVMSYFPIGTSERAIAAKAQELGIGRDNLSSYNPIEKRSMVAIRVEYDPTTYGLVKGSWIISLHFDSDRQLKSIGAERYLTGL
jgi:hypothetical protein